MKKLPLLAAAFVRLAVPALAQEGALLVATLR
jgi:hypothetical protein